MRGRPLNSREKGGFQKEQANIATPDGALELQSQFAKRSTYSPKKNLETETTLSRLTKRLSNYETEVTMRL
jgi:hypothetical protein